MAVINNSIQIKDKIEVEKLIKISPFRKEIRKTEPHKHNNYFEIIYLRQGSGTHTIDHNEFNIKTPTIFFIRKEQVHHWDMTSEPDGYVLLLKKGFIDQSLDNELKRILSEVSAISCLHLKENDTIEAIFKLLIGEKDFTVIEGLLKALLAKINGSTIPFNSTQNNKNNTFLLFRALLNETEELRNSVAFYAEKLNTTPQNLNAICRKALNQSAAEIIAEHIISESKRVLTYTNQSVSELANTLHFSDTSHFVKYFKRHTGTTPQTFRTN